MGQQEVYNFLKRHRNKWISAREIISKLKISQGAVAMSLSKLRKGKIINHKLAKKSAGGSSKRKVYVYRFKE